MRSANYCRISGYLPESRKVSSADAYFDQAEPSAILDHCDQWLMKFVRAEREGVIQLKNVLIPVAAPTENDSPRHRKAVQIAKDSIQERGLQLVDYQATQKIAAFAQSYVQ